MGDEEEEQEEEDCEECKISAGVIVSAEICQTLKEKSDIDCKQLMQDFSDKKISPNEYMDTLIKHAENVESNVNVDILKEIKRLMHNG